VIVSGAGGGSDEEGSCGCGSFRRGSQHRGSGSGTQQDPQARGFSRRDHSCRAACRSRDRDGTSEGSDGPGGRSGPHHQQGRSSGQPKGGVGPRDHDRRGRSVQLGIPPGRSGSGHQPGPRILRGLKTPKIRQGESGNRAPLPVFVTGGGQWHNINIEICHLLATKDGKFVE